MLMIRASAILGTLIAIGCVGAQTQQSPPPPPQSNAPSPVIILPPQDSQGTKPAGTSTAAGTEQAPPEGNKSAPGKSGKGKVDASKVPAKDPTAVGPAYVIGPEDALYIRVWQQPELSGSVTVGPDGTISLQLIDEVKASGLTPRQLEEELARRFTKFIKEPEVNVQVLRVNSRTYIIQGDGVIRPGIYPLTRPMTVLEALIAGGGFSPFANKKKIYVLRGTERFYFNWNDVSKGKHLEQNIKIQNGDQIFVP
jgi:polysaccharide export outer membrane protein